MSRHVSLLWCFMGAVCLIWPGCATAPPSSPALRQQAEADLVVRFQTWNAITFVKPDLTGIQGGVTFWRKSFTREAVEKLMNNMKGPRDFVVVILDRETSPQLMDEVQAFFQGLGFRRVAFQDGTSGSRTGDLPILRDTAAPPKP